MSTLMQHLQDLAQGMRSKGTHTWQCRTGPYPDKLQLRRIIVVSSSPQINESGHVSAPLRNDSQLHYAIIELETLADVIAHAMSDSTSVSTTTSPLRLFWHPAPDRKTGISIVQGIPDGDYTLCMVRSLITALAKLLKALGRTCGRRS